MSYISEKRKTVGLQKLKTVKKGSGRYARIIKRAGITEKDLLPAKVVTPQKKADSENQQSPKGKKLKE